MICVCPLSVCPFQKDGDAMDSQALLGSVMNSLRTKENSVGGTAVALEDVGPSSPLSQPPITLKDKVLLIAFCCFSCLRKIEFGGQPGRNIFPYKHSVLFSKSAIGGPKRVRSYVCSANLVLPLPGVI